MTSEFGALLRQLRRRVGLTQQQLGERAGVTDRTIRRLERDAEATPQLETVRLLADALDLGADEYARLLAVAGGSSGSSATAVPEPPRRPPARIVSTVERALVAAGDELANAVAARCKREEELRRIQDPFPLTVRWRAAPDELTDHWANIHRAAAGAEAGPIPLDGKLDEIVDVHRRIPSGRLVVLGKGGSGKTMLAVRFVLDVLAARQSGDVVPVLVGLGSWDPTRAGLRDWLTGRLERDHPGLAATGDNGATLAATLVATDRVLPVLDGFDEIAEGLHLVALAELNRTTMPLLLTSRPHHYATAVARSDVLTAAAGVEVTDLTVADLADYLPRTTRATGTGVTGWDAVLTELREHPHGAAGANLRAVLTTPLMVGLARAGYSDTPGRDPAELLDTNRFPTPEAVEDHLLSSFVSTAYSDGRPARWEPDRVHRWLRYLAGHLHHLGDRRDLAWWELGTSLRPLHRILVIGFGAGLAVGLVDLCVNAPLFGLPGALLSAAIVVVVAGLALGVMHWLAARSVGVVLQPTRARMSLRGPKRQHRRLGTRVRYGLGAGFALGGGFAVLTDVAPGAKAWQPGGLLFTGSDLVVFGVVFAVGAGLAAGLVAVLEAPLDVESVVSPADLLRINRTTMTFQLLVFGSAFAAIVATGTWGVVRLLQATNVGAPVGLAFTWDPVVGICLGLIGGLGGGLGYVLSLTAWGQWAVLARVWLPLTGRLPWALNAFLDDACRRGLLRQSGAVHQFRHARLQDHLTAADQP